MTDDAQSVLKSSTTTSDKKIVFIFTRWEGEPNEYTHDDGYIREYKREIVAVE